MNIDGDELEFFFFILKIDILYLEKFEKNELKV